MSKYFLLSCLSPIGFELYRVKVPYPLKRLRWKAGSLFSDKDKNKGFHPPNQIIEIDTVEESVPIPRLYAELYWVPIPLMTRRLVNAFHAAGVDNLQTFETKFITTQGDDPPPSDQYLAINIVGKVAAADLDKSETNPEVSEKMISADFHSLVIDEKKARDLLMFRLAENISAVVVHERVKNAIEKSGITNLTWTPPERWAG